jgi:hypothetical protein
MQRSFMAILTFVTCIVFLGIVAYFTLVGASLGVIGFAGAQMVMVPVLGPMTPQAAGAIGGFVVGIFLATLSCGALFTLIAIANNTRMTRDLLALR